MKILQVIPFFGPQFGGSFVSTYNLSVELSKKGHDVTIITTDFEYDEKCGNNIKRNGVKVITFHCVINLGFFLFSPSMKKWLSKNLKDFDIIHLQTFRSYQNNLIHSYSKKFNVPYLLQARGSIPRNVQKTLLKRMYDNFWGYNLINDASTLIALSENELKQYIEMGADPKKIKIVPNGKDLSKFNNLPEWGNFRTKYEIEKKEKIILYLGQIHKIKGISMLISAFADLLNDIDNSKLVIVGPDRGFLNNLKKQVDKLKINDSVLFVGPLYMQDKLEAFIDADVYVLPSKREGFPNTILESCLCRTPVIATNGCGITDFVNKIGYTVDYDKKQLRNAIFKVLNQEDELKEDRRRLVMENFSIDKTVDEIINIYKVTGRENTYEEN